MDEKTEQELNKILREEQVRITAEQAHDHASMLLLTRMYSRVGLLAVLSKQMFDQGPDFTAATLAALVSNARNLATRFAANPTADFSDCLSEPARDDRASRKATEILRAFMVASTLEEGVQAGETLRQTLRDTPALEAAELAMHIVSASAQLVSLTMEQADELSLDHIRGEHDDR